MKKLPYDIFSELEEYIPLESSLISLLNKSMWELLRYTPLWYRSIQRCYFGIEPTDLKNNYNEKDPDLFNWRMAQLCSIDEHKWVGIYWCTRYCTRCTAILRPDGKLEHFLCIKAPQKVLHWRKMGKPELITTTHLPAGPYI
tara:strand:+ start:1017 stop:1442 length:426 start_codon:yes stop_codon:yes gene_type:complete